MPNPNPAGLSPAQFDHLVEAAGPVSLLLVIESRLGHALRGRLTAEDILQEALLHAWRDRDRIESATGAKGFRAWLLTIIDHRIHDAVDRELAVKRGGQAVTFALDRPAPPGGPASHVDGSHWLGAGSTTPSRVASLREQAAAMRVSLDSLPAELREVVFFRLIEQRSIDEIVASTGLTHAAVRHRLRKGAELLRYRLVGALGSRCPTPANASIAEDSAPAGGAASS